MMPLSRRVGHFDIARWIVAIVHGSARRAWLVVVLATMCTTGAIYYTVEHIAMDTNISRLLPTGVAWRERELRFDALFPERFRLIVIVVDGATPEIAERAAEQLTTALKQIPDRFQSVRRPDGGAFFDKHGLLFLSTDELERTTEQLIAAQPLLGALAQDPSVRGLLDALSLVVEGVQRGEIEANALARPLSALADTLESVLAGRITNFSLRTLLAEKPPDRRELRRFILVQPRLDYTALQPGAAATDAIREGARQLNLTSERGVRVRLTGDAPLADEEFATLADRAELNAAVTMSSMIVLLWLAVRSARIIFAVFVCLIVGLAITTAFGLFVYQSLNLISVAFAVLFVGLGIDFGIQFSVSYRAHRFARDDTSAALVGTARDVGPSLALAAAATAIGFYAFLPTDYRGVSELGAIAGTGMLVAFATTITLLPALLRLLPTTGERAPIGYLALAPVDRFIIERRSQIRMAAAIIALISIAAMPSVEFDFNPLNLRSAETESVSTLLDLMRDPETSPNTIDVIAPSLDEAQSFARRLAALPEVSQAVTLASFIPAEQQQKLALISDAALLLDATLNPISVSAAPDDSQLVEAMKSTAESLQKLAPQQPNADAARVSRALIALASAGQAEREALRAAIVSALNATLDQLRASLTAGPVTLQTLPSELINDWRAKDGSARIQVTAKGDSNDNETLQRFVEAVRTVAPNASGPAVSIQESGKTIVAAFVEAGLWAFAAITILLAIVLRSARDVLLTLAPLVLSGLTTLALCVVLPIPLNFANVIALPLMLGIGVAFNIYFVMAWRAGSIGLLQSSLARAVIFSALTTAIAFGSLWLSSHPGTSSMGKLLALSLCCTLVCVLFVLPALLGPAPERAPKRTSQ
ncbi:MAG: MMPL family transporter [Burkholderiaceae bacterium]